ncbi:MAG: CDP-diacylglycerol--glycerol-3-phosphate 3-phosphatidyltransferase [Armatimonadetes bacterium]|nr:CDP-diacylglycerol--glycerol-3-phosphate 3-phosphatidyltransferase [Armatimonadota bacterium]
MIKYIPNFLTILRMVLVPIFIWLIFFAPFASRVLLATVVLIVAGITDYFDGMLARKFKVVTDFGKIMDPLADKMLVLSALLAIALSPINYISIFVVFIILFREIAVSILRNYYARKNIYLAANIWGKLKTVLQMLGVIAALVYYSLSQIIQGWNPHQKCIVLGFRVFFWVVVFITILSGMNYFFLRKKDREKSGNEE